MQLALVQPSAQTAPLLKVRFLSLDWHTPACAILTTDVKKRVHGNGLLQAFPLPFRQGQNWYCLRFSAYTFELEIYGMSPALTRQSEASRLAAVRHTLKMMSWSRTRCCRALWTCHVMTGKPWPWQTHNPAPSRSGDRRCEAIGG